MGEFVPAKNIFSHLSPIFFLFLACGATTGTEKPADPKTGGPRYPAHTTVRLLNSMLCFHRDSRFVPQESYQHLSYQPSVFGSRPYF
jgi:hypothetical protein